jgi:hypothetical protein
MTAFSMTESFLVGQQCGAKIPLNYPLKGLIHQDFSFLGCLDIISHG